MTTLIDLVDEEQPNVPQIIDFIERNPTPATLNVVDYEQHTPLWLACDRGHLEVVKILLDLGADIEASDTMQMTPLIIAIIVGHLDVVKILLDFGADIEARDFAQKTPLLAAVQERHLDVVKILLDRGADIEARDIEQKTPLHAAVQERHLDVVKILLDRGADVNARDENQSTPLHYAAVAPDNVDMVKLLIDRGADTSLLDNEGKSFVDIAIRRDNTKDGVRWFEKYCYDARQELNILRRDYQLLATRILETLNLDPSRIPAPKVLRKMVQDALTLMPGSERTMELKTDFEARRRKM